MFLCVNCGNNIKCDCCNKRNNYKYFINYKLLFTPTLDNLRI